MTERIAELLSVMAELDEQIDSSRPDGECGCVSAEWLCDTCQGNRERFEDLIAERTGCADEIRAALTLAKLDN